MEGRAAEYSNEDPLNIGWMSRSTPGWMSICCELWSILAGEQALNGGSEPLPTTVEVSFQDGTKTRVKLPVETWLQKGTYTWVLEKKTPIASVVVDSDHQLPDDDRGNNEKRTQ